MPKSSEPPPFPEFARFRVLEVFAGGEGWTGAVRDGSGETLVLKVFDDARLHEASLLASLSHPRIPRVLEAGTLADGRGFLIREHVAGQPLRNDTILAGDAATALATQLLEVLAFIHQRGVSHFDIKPANVILRDRSGGPPEFVLLDFGLGARPRDVSHGGTPFFAAPERALGLPGDGRSDLFSLGVLLYCVTRPRAAPLPLLRHRERFPRESFLAAVGARLDAVPEPLRSCMRRLLARRPTDRFPDAEEALEALAGRSGRPSPAVLRPDPIAIYGDAVAACAAGLGPDRDLRIAGGEADVRSTLAFHAASALPAAPPVTPGTGSMTGTGSMPGTGSATGTGCTTETGPDAVILRRGGRGPAEFRILPLSRDQIEMHLRAVFRFDDGTAAACAAHLDAAGYGSSISSLERVLRDLVAARAIVPEGSRWVWPDALSGRIALDSPPLPPEITTPDEVRAAAMRGHVEQARDAYRRALPDLDATADRQWRAALAEGLLLGGEPARCLPFVSDLPVHHARALLDLGRLDAARARLAAVADVPAAELHVAEHDRQRLRATLEHLSGRSTLALELLDPFADGVPERITRSLVLRSLGRTDEALAILDPLLATMDREAQPFLHAAALTCRADCRRSRGDLEAARAGYQAAQHALSALGHVRHSATAATNLGVIAKDLGDFAAALRYQRQARAMYEHVGDRHGWASAQANYGLLHLAAGDPTSARAKLASALAEFGRLGAQQNVPRLLVELARAHAALGERDAAAACLDRAAATGDATGDATLAPAIDALRRQLAHPADPLPTGEIGETSETSETDETKTVRTRGMTPTNDASVPKEVFRTYLAVNRRLAGEADLERAMTYLLEAATTLTGGRSGYLLVVREDGIRRELRCGDSDAPAIAFSRSMVHRAIQQGRTQTAEDVLADHALTEMQSVQNLRSRSAVCAPFATAGGHKGALYVEHPTRAGMFGEREKEHLEILADQAAIAVDRMFREEALAQELQQSRHDLRVARRVARRTAPTTTMLGKSPPLRALREQIDRIAASDLAVLIRGETGSGKELVARALHEQSNRARGPFLAENCSAIPENLMESEFFGHVKGAFTGADEDRPGLLELASGGTLFLDEIGDMPVALQVKLLRALQESAVRRVGASTTTPIDLRLVSATHKDPRQLIDAGEFREDLFFRIAAVEIRVPPLRERGDDVRLLAAACLDGLNAQHRREVRLAPRAAAALTAYPWPGNVRELHHVIARAFILADHDEIDDLALPAATPPAPGGGEWPAISLKEAEARTIRAALRVTGGDKTKAARLLGISRTAIYEKLRRMAAPEQD